jgi:hypothetical protein
MDMPMNGINPVEYTMEMKIIGYGLMAFGLALLILVAVVSTRMHQRNSEDSRD